MPLYKRAITTVEEDDVVVSSRTATLDFTEPLVSLVSQSPTGEANVDLSGYFRANGGRQASGTFDMNTNLIVNIGNSGTDFTSGGGLNIAGFLNVGNGTGSLATGSGDCLVDQDFEVNGQSRFDGTIGMLTAPNTANIITATSSGSTVTNGMVFDLTTTTSSNPAGGINVLDYSCRDQSTSSATIRGEKILVEFDRGTLPSSNTQVALEVVGYGIKNTRSVTSGTYTWEGIKITGTNAGQSVAGATFTLIDLETSARPTGFSGATSFTHYAAKFGSDVWIDSTSNTSRLGVGVAAAAVLVHQKETISKAGGTTDADGISATHRIEPIYTRASGVSTYTITRHNYLELLDVPTATGVTVTDSCLFRTDAAAGTHKMVDSGTTKTSPGTVTEWLLVNSNGNVRFIPMYSSKTS